MNKAYYSKLDKIIMRSRRRRMARRYAEQVVSVVTAITIAIIAYGTFYGVWSLLCYVFPDW